MNVWLGKLTVLNMTSLGWLGHKTSTQTNKIEFLHVNQMGSFFIFDTPIKGHHNNEQISQGDFRYMVSVMCWQDLCLFLLPDKM